MEIILVSIAIFMGSLIQRVIGFGMPIIVIPTLFIYFSPATALIMAFIVGIISSLFVVNDLKQTTVLNNSIYKVLFPASVIGIGFGAWVLTISPKSYLQISLGVLIVIGLIIQKYFQPIPKNQLKPKPDLFIYAIFAGFFNSTVGLSAGPLIIWIRKHIVSPNSVRLLLAFNFIFMNVLSIFFLHYFDRNAFILIPTFFFILFLPIIFIANYTGSILSNKIKETHYNSIVFYFLATIGVLTTYYGINSL